MKRKILIEKESGMIRTFLIEDDDIVEIHSVPETNGTNNLHAVGDIYVGRVKNIVANIGAAFIEIAPGINCYFDLCESGKALFTKKTGNKPLCIGDELVIQISREAVKTKAPTVSASFSLTGRYAVLTHGNTRIGVSSKIPRSLREEFKERLDMLRNESFGIIVRTNAKDADFQDVLDEIMNLKKEYEHLTYTAHTRVCFSCLKSAPPSYISDLKNAYMEGMEEIIVGDEELYTKIQDYFQSEMPERCGIVRLYNDPSYPLGKLYSTQTALEKALREKVWIKSGGYLIIQPTEALTVIDVNSGKNIGKAKNEDGIMKINLEAAKESARQIRLRNLSGIILIDFINMEEPEHVEQLLREFRMLLSRDPIQTTLVDITPLNLVEVTRKKVRKPLAEQVAGQLKAEFQE